MTIEQMKNQLSQFLAELKLQEKADHTLQKYEGDISKFFEFINDDSAEITKSDVIDYKSYICSGIFKTASINSYIIALNKYLKWLGAPDMTVKIIKQQRKSSLEEVISRSDYKRLLRYAKKLGMIDIYYIMRVLASTGIRIDELKFITVDSLKTCYIRVNNKGKEREITIPPELVRELRKYCASIGVKNGYVFQSSIKNNIVCKSTVWRKMKKIAGYARVNKSKVHAHSFRHLFAKEYMNTYNNVTELADIMGHNSLETTRIYTRSTSFEKRKKIEKLGF
jgi:site-specific recombinase XerD